MRVGLGGVFFLFSIDKFFNPTLAQGWLPGWLSTILPIDVTTFVYLFGIFEGVISLLLLIGLYTRVFAGLASGLLFAIILSWGLNEVMIRDAGLLFLALGIAVLGAGMWSLDARLRNHSAF